MPELATKSGVYQQGFGLLEVLISMLLAGLVLLGLIATQIKALQYASSSLSYTVAAIQAQNAVERVWPSLCGLQRGDIVYDAALQAQLLPVVDMDPPGFVVQLLAPGVFDFTSSPYAYASGTPGNAPVQPAAAATPVLPAVFAINVSWNDQRFNDGLANTLDLHSSFPWLRNGGAC